MPGTVWGSKGAKVSQNSPLHVGELNRLVEEVGTRTVPCDAMEVVQRKVKLAAEAERKEYLTLLVNVKREETFTEGTGTGAASQAEMSPPLIAPV